MKVLITFRWNRGYLASREHCRPEVTAKLCCLVTYAGGVNDLPNVR